MDWTDWDTLNTVKLSRNCRRHRSIAIQLAFKLHGLSGIERYFENHFWVAGGYFYSPNSTNDRDFDSLGSGYGSACWEPRVWSQGQEN